MMKAETELKSLIAEIQEELAHLEGLKHELDRIAEEGSLPMRRAQGSILHDFYNGCERIFRNIAEGINGEVDPGEAWHRNLLYRMTLDLREVRPRVISDELAGDLDEYLAFRHVFRNIYGFELREDRLHHLISQLDRTFPRFKAEISVFLHFLEHLT